MSTIVQLTSAGLPWVAGLQAVGWLHVVAAYGPGQGVPMCICFGFQIEGAAAPGRELFSWWMTGTQEGKTLRTSRFHSSLIYYYPIGQSQSRSQAPSQGAETHAPCVP